MLAWRCAPAWPIRTQPLQPNCSRSAKPTDALTAGCLRAEAARRTLHACCAAIPSGASQALHAGGAGHLAKDPHRALCAGGVPAAQPPPVQRELALPGQAVRHGHPVPHRCACWQNGLCSVSVCPWGCAATSESCRPAQARQHGRCTWLKWLPTLAPVRRLLSCVFADLHMFCVRTRAGLLCSAVLSTLHRPTAMRLKYAST